MQKPEGLLPNNQFHWAVIRAQNSIMDDNVSNTWDECLRNEEVIEPPAYAALTCRETIRPPCILDAIRIKVAVGIHETMVEKLLQHCPFLRQEAGCSYILFRVFQINGHVGSIEIPGNDDILTHCMQSITCFQKMSIEIQLIVDALSAALAAREVDIEQTEIRVKRGNEAALHIKEGRVHTQLSLKRGGIQKCGYSTISSFGGRIPNDFVAGEIKLLFRKLVRAGFDLL